MRVLLLGHAAIMDKRKGAASTLHASAAAKEMSRVPLCFCAVEFVAIFSNHFFVALRTASTFLKPRLLEVVMIFQGSQCTFVFFRFLTSFALVISVRDRINRGKDFRENKRMSRLK